MSETKILAQLINNISKDNKDFDICPQLNMASQEGPSISFEVDVYNYSKSDFNKLFTSGKDKNGGTHSKERFIGVYYHLPSGYTSQAKIFFTSDNVTYFIFIDENGELVSAKGQFIGTDKVFATYIASNAE